MLTIIFKALATIHSAVNTSKQSVMVLSQFIVLLSSMYLTHAMPSDQLSTRPVHSMAEYVHPRFVVMHAHALECESLHSHPS
jgi:hypothetical protein